MQGPRVFLWSVVILLCGTVKAQQGNFSLLPRTDFGPPVNSLLRTSQKSMDLVRMPTPWSYERLGVFCKLDVQLERHLRIPVLFRLGDVQRVEAMEGKGPLREIR
ncbi:MAG: hypothetical protein IT229_07160 [Flavobacteriales bacterium]|nr:hypothetical protein [Flavobacteriales bacterium]